MYGKFINDIFGGFMNLIASRVWGSDSEVGYGPVNTGYGPINTGYGPINSGYGPIN